MKPTWVCLCVYVHVSALAGLSALVSLLVQCNCNWWHLRWPKKMTEQGEIRSPFELRHVTSGSFLCPPQFVASFLKLSAYPVNDESSGRFEFILCRFFFFGLPKKPPSLACRRFVGQHWPCNSFTQVKCSSYSLGREWSLVVLSSSQDAFCRLITLVFGASNWIAAA